MNAFSRQRFWVAVALIGSQLLSGSLLAQTVTNAPVSPRSNPAPPLPPMLIPPMLSVKSPVELFRELLAMNTTERKEFLTNRSPASQKLILAKVREYESLKPDQRELRLQVTDLRWYLLPLMRVPATNRTSRLEKLSSENRKLIEVRLQQWDRLPASAQKELLDNEAMIQHLTEIEGRTE